MSEQNEMRLVGYLFGERIFMKCGAEEAEHVWHLITNYMRHGGAYIREDLKRVHIDNGLLEED